jgi:glycosyltransferase involved in cell wall biosynthesis
VSELRGLTRMHGANAEYARRLLVAGPGNLETFTQQARTRQTRDAFALAASRGSLDYAGLIARVMYESARPEIKQTHPTKTFDQRSFLALARIVANQAATPDETYEASQMFKAAIRGFGTKALKRMDRLVFLESLAALGHVADVEKYTRILSIGALDRNQSALLEANAVAIASGASHAVKPSDRWLDLVNEGYRRSAIETISFAPGEGALFDRILCGPSEHITDGPKVTVIVPTYNSGPRIATALRSLVNQTWRNLEILVMDDASPAENDRYLDEWVARDTRISVHKMSENGGTYRARNYAMTHLVTGDFVTVHDDDDWSHPRKIELQVQQLLDQPELIANMSLLSRATPELVFTRINNNAVFTQPNYSSLMFRREPVVEKVGFWDLVNRSADAEFHDRLKAVFGGATGVAGVDPMSFLRVRSDSLTSGEISRGYIDRRRIWYQQSSREWHSRTLSRGGSVRVEAFPSGPRPFSAPKNMIGSKHSQERVEVDVLYVTDFRFPGGNSSLAAAELDLLLQEGYRVGLMQLTSPVNAAQATVLPRFLELAQNPLVSVVSTLDPVHARLTLVRHPSVLQYPEPVRSSIDTDELVVIVNHAPYSRDGLGSLYDLSQVAQMARTIFGRAASFAPESNLIRQSMAGAVLPSSVLSLTWPGIVSMPEVPPTEVPAPRRIIGRHSRDHVAKWPEDPNTMLASYPDSRKYEVRILGGAEKARAILGELPNNWTVHSFGTMEPADFLRDIPFWVYQHHTSLTESFGMAAAEAVAAGCVVILPPYMEASFGEGAVYAEPSAVLGVIESFIADPDAYYAQRARAISFATERFSAQAFLTRVASLLEESRNTNAMRS